MRLADRIDIGDGPRIVATPWPWRDARSIPQREWLYGRTLLRGSLSLIVAPGAAGKTAFTVGQSLSLASGRNLLGQAVWGGPKRVWLWNLEDSADEIDRLIAAGVLHWGLQPEHLEGRLFRDNAMSGAELVVAEEGADGFKLKLDVIADLTQELRARKIDVLTVDPFVSAHRASENDNRMIDAIAKAFAHIAVDANCAVQLVHHSIKIRGGEVNADAARGASALVNAARSAQVLNRMTDEEAARFAIEEERRRRYFRVYDDKPNRAPPADQSDWFELVSVSLGNGENGGDGDSLPVVVPWSPPDIWDDMTPDHLRRVQAAIADGEWRKSDQASDWVGIPIAEVLGLDVERKADKSKVRKYLAEWIKGGALKEDRRKDKHGDLRPFIVVGEAVLA
ncbi:AAA family ATPase [Sphingomonas antarctica]|uniref:AAA family ATPase n=1 Tax=Sphingomonas antarctica TaxID=2040274 RepID=UPI0039EA04CD